MSPSPGGLNVAFGGLSLWQRKWSIFFAIKCFLLLFLLFPPERSNSKGRTVAKASGLKPAAVFGSLVVQPCLLKALAQNPSFKPSLMPYRAPRLSLSKWCLWVQWCEKCVLPLHQAEPATTYQLSYFSSFPTFFSPGPCENAATFGRCSWWKYKGNNCFRYRAWISFETKPAKQKYVNQV